MSDLSGASQWPLFDAVSPEDARAVLSVARRRRYAKGETIFHEGDPGDCIHLISTGHVAIRVTTPLGETATLTVLGPGGFFGQMALVSPGPRSATAAAIDHVETRTLHLDQLEELRRKHQGVDRVLIEAFVADVRRLSGQLSDALYVSVPSRMARRLLELAVLFGDGGPEADDIDGVVIPLTQDDLAGLVGTTRPTANKTLRELAEGGILNLARGKVMIRSGEGLRRKAR